MLKNKKTKETTTSRKSSFHITAPVIFRHSPASFIYLQPSTCFVYWLLSSLPSLDTRQYSLVTKSPLRRLFRAIILLGHGILRPFSEYIYSRIVCLLGHLRYAYMRLGSQPNLPADRPLLQQICCALLAI